MTRARSGAPGGLDRRAQLRPATSRILLVVIDGFGAFDNTELQDAATPRLDARAADGVVGLLDPVGFTDTGNGVDLGRPAGHVRSVWLCQRS